MDTDEDKLNRLTERIIGCAFRVHNVLGSGFSEKVYENALVHDLKKSGLVVAQQPRVEVFYDGVLVGGSMLYLCSSVSICGDRFSERSA